MGVNYLDTIERMRWAGKLKNESAIARAIGVTPQALSNYKKRGSMPSDLVLRFAELFGLSVDWLISGEGDMYMRGSGKASGMSANEDTHAYGTQGHEALSISGLSAEESAYVAKLLKVMRTQDGTNSAAIKNTIDAFLKASETADVAITG